MNDNEKAAVVIDNGSGTVKAGFAGDDAPKSIFPNFVGRRRFASDEVIVGKAAMEERHNLNISYPMDKGLVQRWDDMESIWDFIYKNELKIDESSAKEHSVLLTDAPTNSIANRVKAAEIFLEKHGAPSFFMNVQAVLSLYSSGRSTGLLVDCGDGVSFVVPVYEGYCLTHNIQRIDVGGRTVTEHLKLLLRKEGHSFHRSAEFETLRILKEQYCYLAKDPTDEGKLTPADVLLPDGTEMKLGTSRINAPELLFHPEIIGVESAGVADAVGMAIAKSDIDLRKPLWENIVLCGGTSRMRGFGARLIRELRGIAPERVRPKVTSPTDPILCAWKGGSILSSIDCYRRMWITQEDWAEHGPNVVKQKTF